MPCARELGINTMQQMAGGLDLGDMQNLESQMMEIMDGEDGGGAFGEFFSARLPKRTNRRRKKALKKAKRSTRKRKSACLIRSEQI